MNWDDIRVFVIVAECKSLSKAAQLLRVTPGALSRRLDDLEEALDVRLLTRSSSGVTLTPAGEDMLDRALSMRRFAESIEDLVRSRDKRDEGMVTIRAPDGITAYWIAPKLPRFQNENPKIQLTLDCGTLTDYVSGDPDIVITADKTEARVGDVIEPLAVFHYVLMASPSYFETYGTPKSTASAAGDHRTLRHVAQTYQREAWDARASAIETLASFSVVSNSSSAIIAAVLAGGGICTAPTLFCHLYPELQMVGAEHGFPIQVWAVIRKEAQSSVRVQRTHRWLKSIFDTKFNPWFRDEFVPPRLFAEELASAPGRTAPETRGVTPPRPRTKKAT